MSELPQVTLYGRSGCHLCSDARRLLDRLAPRLGFTVAELEIDSDPDLLARYDLVIPVIAVGGVEVGRAPVREGAIEQRLRQALSAGQTLPAEPDRR